MNRTSLFLTLGLALLPSFLSAQTSIREFHQLPNAPVVGNRFEDIYFTDEKHGWAVEITDELHRTSDGGLTWNKQDIYYEGLDTTASWSVAPRCISFHDQHRGWVGTLNTKNPLLGTTDGGDTWHSVTTFSGPKPFGICGLSIVNDSIVYGAGRFDIQNPPNVFGDFATVVKTIDGGKTWESIDMSKYALSLVDIHFFSKDSGLVSGTAGGQGLNSGNIVVVGTTDGGTTWTERFRETKLGGQGWKIFFRTRTEGYVAVQDRDSTKYYLSTTDGGFTWTKHSFWGMVGKKYTSVQGIMFTSATDGYVGGYGPFVYTTTDAGVSWTPTTVPGNDYVAINRWRKLNDSVSYCAGNAIYFYKRGEPMTAINSLTTQNSKPIYPNPAKEHILIEMPVEGLCYVSIIDNRGSVVKQLVGDAYAKVDVADLPTGAYTARIVRGTTQWHKSFVVKR